MLKELCCHSAVLLNLCSFSLSCNPFFQIWICKSLRRNKHPAKLLLTSWAQRDRTLQETFTFTDKRESLLVIQIQERQKFFLAATKKFTFQKRLKKMLSTRIRGKSCRPEIHRRKSICVSRPLSMKQAAKIMHICSVVIYPLEKKIHWNKQHFGTRYKSFVAYRPPFTHCICEVVTGTPGGGGHLGFFWGGMCRPGLQIGSPF